MLWKTIWRNICTFEDEYADKLREFGESLGRFVYILDACIDLKKRYKT